MKFAYNTGRPDAREATQNESIDLNELQQKVEGGAPKGYEQLQELARQKIAGQAGAAEKLAAAKKLLGWIIASGYCPKGHYNETLIYNSVLQLDYDDKELGGDARAAELLEKCPNVPGVLMAAISPTGYGLKILLFTDNPDKEKHGEALAAAIQIVSEMLQVKPEKFDKLPASCPFYIPYNTPGRPAAYFNHDAQPLALNIQSQTTQRSRSAKPNAYPTDIALNAVNYLIASGADVASERKDYVRLHAACINAFGHTEGGQIAFDLLNNSAAFRASDYSKQFRQNQKRINRAGGTLATGATLIWLAGKHGWKYEKNGTPTEYLKAEPDEMLLDSLLRTGTDIYGKMIIAGTGTGKTTAICRLAEINQRKTVLIVPTKAIIRQIIKQHASAIGFFGGNRSLPKNAWLIVTTADSCPALATRINTAEYDCWLDEAHGLANATSPGYKLKQLRAIMEQRQQWRSFGYLTGTPLYHSFAPMLKDVPRIKYEQDGAAAAKKTAEFLKTDNTVATILKMVNQSIKKGRMPVVMLNDKNLRLAALKALTKDIKALIINADEKEHPDFLTLIESGTIPAEAQAIICTSVIQMGNSIYDQRGFDFITADMLHAAELVQATARARNAADIYLYIVRSNSRKESSAEMNAARFFDAAYKSAEKTCDELNSPDRRELADATLALYYELTIRRMIQHDPIKQTDAGLQPCELALMNRTFEAERQLQHANDKLMARALKAYGFTIFGESRAENGGELARTASNEDSKLTDEQVESVKSAKAEHKEKKEKKYYADLQELADAPNAEAVLMQADRDNKLTDAQERVKTLTDRYGLPIKTAVCLLQKEKASPQAFKHLRAEISAEALQRDSGYKALQTKLYIQMRAIRWTFNNRGAMTATDIRNALLPSLKLDDTLDLSKFMPNENDSEAVSKANREALQYLRVYFDVIAAGKPGSRACPRKYVFIIKNKEKFHGHALPELRDARLRETYEAALRPAFIDETELCPF